MPLRLVEVTVRRAERGALSRLAEVLQDRPLVDSWAAGGDDEREIVRLLVRAREVEDVVDALSKRYAGDGRFRVVLLPAEATVPAAEETPSPENEQVASGPARVSRDELYADLADACEPSGRFALQVVLSTLVAAVGLLGDNLAVVIGAMVIAPLLGPNVALAFGATLGDLRFVARALKTNLLGLATALVLAVAVGMVLPIDPGVPSIAARTHASLSDIVLALASGIAGTLAFAAGTGTSLIGVMVAVALLPPLAVAGLLTGAGFHAQAVGAGLLLATNVICINLSAVATFVALGVRPRAWWEQAEARRSSRAALLVWTLLLTGLLVLLLLKS